MGGEDSVPVFGEAEHWFFERAVACFFAGYGLGEGGDGEDGGCEVG